MNLIAIDPGASGGFATYDDGIVSCAKLPETIGDFKDIMVGLKANSPDWICFMEDVPSFIGGKKLGNSMTKLHRSAGRIEGVLCALGFRVEMLTPQKWQKFFSLGKRSECATDTIWKGKLKNKAQQLFPNCTVTLQVSDALLILEYGMKQQIK